MWRELEHTLTVEGFSRQSCSSRCQQIRQTHSPPICSTRCDTEQGKDGVAHWFPLCSQSCHTSHATRHMPHTANTMQDIPGHSTTVSVIGTYSVYAYPGILVLHKISPTNRAEILLPFSLLSHKKRHRLVVHWYVHLKIAYTCTCVNIQTGSLYRLYSDP